MGRPARSTSSSRPNSPASPISTRITTITIDTVIVGAGAAGLAAAVALRAAGRTTLVLEAAAEPGGRARTTTPAALGGAWLDEGAAWLHMAEHNPLVPLAARAGHRLREAFRSDSRMFIGDRLATEADQAEYEAAEAAWYDRVMSHPAEPDTDLATATGPFRHENPWAPTIEAWQASLIDAVDAPYLSLADFRLNQLDGRNLIAEQGFGRLLRDLLEADAGPIRCLCPVQRIAWDGLEMRIETPQGTISAASVIVTVSTGVLGAGLIAFDPPLPVETQAAITNLPMGLLSKVVLRAGGADRLGMTQPTHAFRRLERLGDPFMSFIAWPRGTDHTIGFVGGDAAWAVAIDPRNGQVLAMVSVPSFDPNLFVNGIGQADYNALTYAPDKPLFDRALKGAYPPGSTVKPFLALGGLEYGVRRPQDTVLSTGEFCLPGQKRCYRDDDRGGNGTVNMVRAIELSSNTYFYKLALDLGIDRLSAWMSQFSFGSKTGIDLTGEGEGVLPSREWKAKHISKQGWFPGETVITGIGQGYWAVTPLQLGHAVATLAGHGTPYLPRLVMATRASGEARPQMLPNPPSGPSLIQKPSDWNVINEGMRAVITGGTGKGINDGFPFLIAGKSGTAERFSRTSDAYDTNKSTAHLAARHRAWFEAYTPADDPKIAAAALLEAGAWGAKDAGPIVRKIFDSWAATQVNPTPSDTPLPYESLPAPAGSVPVEDQPVEDRSVEAQPAESSSSGDGP